MQEDLKERKREICDLRQQLQQLEAVQVTAHNPDSENNSVRCPIICWLHTLTRIFKKTTVLGLGGLPFVFSVLF